jgi:hypothetical protein
MIFESSTFRKDPRQALLAHRGVRLDEAVDLVSFGEKLVLRARGRRARAPCVAAAQALRPAKERFRNGGLQFLSRSLPSRLCDVIPMNQRCRRNATDQTDGRVAWYSHPEQIMNVKQMQFSTPEGGHATLALPEPVTLETIEMLEEASALMFRSLRREALRPQGLDAGAIEYDSWSAHAH